MASPAQHATRAASTLLRGNTEGRRQGRSYFSQSRSRSRHMYRPRTGKTLNGESRIESCSLKIGPSRKGLYSSGTPARSQAASTRIAATYE